MISKEALSDQKEYITTWKKLAELGLPKPADRGRTYTPSQVPFWQLLEEAFNDFCSEFLVQKLEGLDRRDLVIDDDKNHFARGAYQYDCGLKLLRHVNDNRMGNTLHSAVMSYSQLMLGVAYERVSGDSAPKASQRLIKRAFIPTAPGDSLGDLRHLGIARDRGYFDKDDVQKYILPSGAHIPASTVKRSAWLAATFDQKMSEQDPRIGMYLCVVVIDTTSCRVSSNTSHLLRYLDQRTKNLLYLEAGRCGSRAFLALLSKWEWWVCALNVDRAQVPRV